MEEPPANTAADDVLLSVFKHLAIGFTSSDAGQRAAAARFIWFRNTLPLVCKRWHRILSLQEGTSLWTTIIIDPAAEVHHVKRYGKPYDVGGASEPPMGPSSGSSTPARGSSPVLGSSPESDSGAYWTSQYSPYRGLPGGSSPPPAALVRQQLTRISLQRSHHHGHHQQPHHQHHHHSRGIRLQSNAVLSWLQRYAAAAAAGAVRLVLDLSHHYNHDFDRQQLEALLAALPKLQSMQLIGAVDGTDAYEPLGRLRQLHELELSSASQACLDGGLMALGFLPCLHSLAVCLDIHPASPCCLNDLPTGLHSLRLGAMWLEALPPQLAELTGLTSIVLERCQMEHNPLPLLLTLPQLASVTIRNASRTAGSSDQGLPRLLPMQQPQLQLQQLVSGGSSRNRGRGGSRRLAAAFGRIGLRNTGGLQTSSEAVSGGDVSAMGAFINTSITALSLVDVGLQQLPGCVSQLVALRDLNLALNHDMGLNPTACLPSELTCITGLHGLCLGHCGLSQLPAVVAGLTALTRLELQGNALSVSGFGTSWGNPTSVGFCQSLRVLDLGGHGSTRGRMRCMPAWVGSCSELRQLRIGCHCLGHGSSSSSSNARSEISMAASLAGHTPGAAAAATQAVQPGTLLGNTAAAATSAGVSYGHAGNGTMGGGSSSGSLARASAGLPSSASSSSLGGSSIGAEGLSLQHLPQLLPQLEVLYIEGGVWEHRAVREALQFVRQLERQGSKLQVVLPL